MNTITERGGWEAVTPLSVWFRQPEGAALEWASANRLLDDEPEDPPPFEDVQESMVDAPIQIDVSLIPPCILKSAEGKDYREKLQGLFERVRAIRKQKREAKWRGYQRQRYHERKAAGVCARCGAKNPVAGQACCESCRDYNRRHSIEHYQRKQQAAIAAAQHGEHGDENKELV